MEYVEIIGGNRLKGEIRLQGSKNGVLPMIAASILCRGVVTIENCPDISDVRALSDILSFGGIPVSLKGHCLVIDSTDAGLFSVDAEAAGKARGSILFLGALLGRFHQAEIAYPGGCVIGKRPIDLHCEVLRKLGAELTERENGVFAKGCPAGTKISLSFPSVGATENAILASVCGRGITQIVGAAREPEVSELCIFLNKAGAKIKGIGTSCLVLEGVERLHGVTHKVSGDRIVAGTYLAAVAMTGGEIVLTETEGCCIEGISEVLRAAGMEIEEGKDRIVGRSGSLIHGIPYVETAPYPGFPTDMQSQTAVLLTAARERSVICEKMFESRFGWIPELSKMGAKVSRQKNEIEIYGTKKLQGAKVWATDLRSGAALILAGLAAEGKSDVYGYHYVARGYENMVGTLRGVGGVLALKNTD